MSAEHAAPTPEKIDFPKVESKVEHHKGREKESTSKEVAPEDARAEVEKALHEAQPTPKAEKAPHSARAKDRHIISGQQKQRAYKKIMTDTQEELSPSGRAFSKFIHNDTVEKTSEVLGHTVARPTSILYGSFCAFVVMLVVYLIAQHNGFRLSGFEFIGLFALGWVLGLLADFFRHMITGQK